jgi:hypothetical protein
MPSNLAAIVLNREISSKRNYRSSIELLLESSYFNSDRKHLAQDFPLNDTGVPLSNEYHLFASARRIRCTDLPLLSRATVHQLVYDSKAQCLSSVTYYI